MTMGRAARLVLLCVALIAGCKGFWDAPSNGGGGGSTTASSGVFYIANQAANQIVGYSINTGVVTALSGSPYTLPAAPVAMAVSPNNLFLYVSTAAGIYVYSIASNGVLTLANSGSAISSDLAQSMQVDATNSWLVEAVAGSPNAFAIALNPSTGGTASASEQSTALPNSAIQQVAISPDNLHIFVAMGTGGTEVISFTPANQNPFGTKFNIPTVHAVGSALSVAVDPSSRLFYIGETVATSGSNTGGLRVFNLGTFKEITGSPFASQGLAPYSILPTSTGDYVYVANRQISGSTAGLIAGYSVASTNSVYSLTALGKTFSAGTHTQSLAEDNTDTFVLAVNFDGNPDLTGYVFDTTNAGYLDSVISSATGTDPVQATAIAALH